MKKMKKVVTLLVAMVMVLSMSLTAFAADKGKITITNPVEGETYKAYKIFDVAYSENRTDVSGYTYTIAESSEWFSTVQAFATEPNNGMTLTANGDEEYIVTVDNAKFKAAVLADDIRTALENDTVTGTENAFEKAADGTLVAANLPLGYYFVSSTSGALCNLTTTEPDVEIRDKNTFPAFKKEDNQRSVQVGDVVTYTIDSLIPDTKGFTTYTYKVSDKMSDGLTFNEDSLTVEIGGKDYNSKIEKIDEEGKEPTKAEYITAYYANNGFVLTFPVMKYQEEAGKSVLITYTATVNEKAIADVEENDAILTYSNDPTDESVTEEMKDKERVYSAQIVINKTGEAGVKLAGAVFVLQNEDGKYYQAVYDGEQIPAVLTAVNWVADLENATKIKTDANGAGNFDGLKDGTYTLTEVEAPKGYNILTDPVTVVVDGDIDVNGNTVNVVADDVHDGTDPKVDDSVLSVKQDVINKRGPILPETGGIGTVIFYVIGAILVIGGSVVLITRSRMNEKN